MARRTKEDALITRDQILDAAERVFLRRGVARTALQEIADEAHLTRGAIYWHFQNKADVFDAMLQRVTLPMVTRLKTQPPGRDREPTPLPARGHGPGVSLDGAQPAGAPGV